MIIKCPQCHEEIEVEQEWAGRKIKCPYCESKFMLVFQDEMSHTEGPKAWTISEIRWRVRGLLPKLNSNSSRSVLLELDKKIASLEDEVNRRVAIEKQKADEDYIRKIPSLFLFAKRILLRHRRYAAAEYEVVKALNELNACRRSIAQYIQGIDNRESLESRREAEEKAKKKATEAIDAQIASVKNAVTSFVREVRAHGVPPVLSIPHFDYQRGELVYACLQHVKWSEVEPNMGDWTACEEGVMYVTNQRVIFTASNHRQVYRIKNIRDFSPCWRVLPDQIYVASSERRREYYLVPKPWFVSAVISVLWNESFRAALMDAEAESAVDSIWDKVRPSAERVARGLAEPGQAYQSTINARGLKEYHVGGKAYVDTRGLSFLEGYAVSFQAGSEGKEILTDWDWQSGRAEAILRGSKV